MKLIYVRDELWDRMQLRIDRKLSTKITSAVWSCMRDYVWFRVRDRLWRRVLHGAGL